MGKIVKVCSKCDEGFAEKFGFCPNCGQALQAFEMSPVAASAPPPPAKAAAPIPERPVETVMPPAEPRQQEAVVETAPVAAPVREVREEQPAPARNEPEPIAAAPAEPVRPSAPIVEPPAPAVIEPPAPRAVQQPAQVASSPAARAEKRETKRAAAAATSAFVASKAMDADARPRSLSAEHDQYASDGGFYVTVIEEKNGAQRNLLLVGSLGFMVLLLTSAIVYNIFSKDLEVGSINDDVFNAVIVDDVPTVTEDEPKPLKKDKDGGGGGGGGREEKEEVTKGDLADQSKNPTRPPDAKVFRSDNFELKTPPPQTEGNKTFEKKYDRWGDPNGRFTSFSNGTGSGGGQGSGVGTGQGSGRGTGAGSGIGSGYGGGIGNGNGNGNGDGSGVGEPPPPRPSGVTQSIKILSKPRPGYTDAARQANVQGTVILRVTFLASGQIGSISPVKGLPNGLTEQAIAAARRIQFEPAKVNGIGQSVTKQIEYTFSIY